MEIKLGKYLWILISRISSNNDTIETNIAHAPLKGKMAKKIRVVYRKLEVKAW